MMNRKGFLLGAPVAAAAIGVAHAANEAPPMSGEQALRKLMAGNERYVRGELRCDVKLERRAMLAAGQSPVVAILSCSDSRVPVEHVFDQPPGTIFVVRVAGNVATTEAIASVEYAVHVLKAPLVMAMGHENCGAVKAALAYKKSGEKLPGQLQSLVDAITPAITSAGESLRDATDQNARRSAKLLDDSSLIHNVKIVSAYFDIASGRVSLLH